MNCIDGEELVRVYWGDFKRQRTGIGLINGSKKLYGFRRKSGGFTALFQYCRFESD